MRVHDLSTVTDAAMQLTERERVKLAKQLLDSLNHAKNPEDDIAEAWDREICHRIAAVQSGQAELLDVDEVIHRVRDRLRN